MPNLYAQILIEDEETIVIPIALLTSSRDGRVTIAVTEGGTNEVQRVFVLRATPTGALSLIEKDVEVEVQPVMTRERKELLRAVQEQKEWITQSGGDLAGYINKYGSRENPNYEKFPEWGYYGSGGEMIYEADTNWLRKLEADAGITADSEGPK